MRWFGNGVGMEWNGNGNRNRIWGNGNGVGFETVKHCSVGWTWGCIEKFHDCEIEMQGKGEMNFFFGLCTRRVRCKRIIIMQCRRYYLFKDPGPFSGISWDV